MYFAGCLADEKGLKEVFDIAGQAGNLPCVLGCLNARNRWCKLAHGEQYFYDCNIDQRKQTTKQHVLSMVQRMNDANPTSDYAKEKWRQSLGINYNVHGILFCTYLMSRVVDPTQHYVRDWMHTWCSGGLAGTHISQVMQALQANDIGIDIVKAYSKLFVSPMSKRIKTDLFFQNEMLTSDNVRHFASDVLTMCFLLCAFLVEKIAPRGIMLSNIECFRKMFKIICTLRRGLMTAEVRDRLKSLIVNHGTQFLELYGCQKAKIKFHHALHLPDDLHRLDCKTFSTFTTEAKNKDALAIVNAADKSIEKTATATFLHNDLQAMIDSTKFARHSYLDGNVKCFLVGGTKCWTSKQSVLPGGSINHGDFVYLVGGSIGKVLNIFDFDRSDEHLVVQIEIHQPLEAAPMRFSLNIDSVTCVSSVDIVEPVWWRQSPNGFIVAIVPEYC